MFPRPAHAFVTQPPDISPVDVGRVGLSKRPLITVCGGSTNLYGSAVVIPAVTPTVTPVVGNPGRGYRFTGNTSNRLQYSGGVTAVQTQYTAACVFVWNSGAANNFPQLCGTSSGNDGWRVGADTSLGGAVAMVKGGVAALSALSVSANIPYFLIVSHDTVTGSYYLLLRNLITQAVTSVTQTNTAAALAGDGLVMIGTSRTDFTGAWNGDIFFCLQTHEFLAKESAEEWLKNPWKIFASPARRFAMVTGAPPPPVFVGMFHPELNIQAWF